jgi:hypothetical protein
MDVVDPYAATITLPATGEVTAEGRFKLKIGLANIGSLDWRLPAVGEGDSRPVRPTAQTLFVLTWRSSDGTELPAAELPAELAPGQALVANLALVAPPDAGIWTLGVDVVNRPRGALSSTGCVLPSMTVRVDPKGFSAEP